ncbi:MAG: nucleotidyltransferase [Alphaproteobacteria bacterium]|nr:nucleotidyltransferase [Alphaproteobacteria bacterium]
MGNLALLGLGSNILPQRNQPSLGSLFDSFYRESFIQESWDAKIREWAERPSNSEQERINRTLRMIKEAISEDEKLINLRPQVYLQGSYRNQTNTKLQSDVDVCVVLTQTVSNNWAPITQLSRHQNNISTAPAQITPQDFKQLLSNALKNKFGSSSIKLSSSGKALKVRPSTARIDADVVPAILYQYHYTEEYPLYSEPKCIEGIAIFTAAGERITNFPHAHCERGNVKDNATFGRYKMLVRFFKRLNLELKGNDYKPLSSFYVESLLYNCPDVYFTQKSLHAAAKSIAEAILIAAVDVTIHWREVNNLKYLWRPDCLFGGGQFSRLDALLFAREAKRKLEASYSVGLTR